jgi:general secretion pathway protein B
MSYILEALKKLEEKRRRTETSQDLLSVCPAAPQEAGRRPVLRYLIAVLLLLNAGLLLWWLLPRQIPGPDSSVVGALSSPSPTRTVSRPEEKNAQRVSSYGAAPGDKDESHQGVSASFPIAVSRTEWSGASAKNAERDGLEIYQPGDLPASVRQELPDITISGHFYAADPSSRVVVINGRPMHEGETLAGGLRLERITSDGVVMDYQGYRFHKGVF